MLYEAIRLGCDLYHKNEWSYNEAYEGFLRENATTILPRGGERSRESPCLPCAFTPLAGGGPKTTNTELSVAYRRIMSLG